MGTRLRSCVRVRSRAGADDALIRGSFASAARSLRSAIHRWNTHIHSVRIHNACMYLYPCAASCPDERIADARPPLTRAHVLRPCARVCACAQLGRPRIRADTCERVPSAVERVRLGSQAFAYASAFNANIGAWNTASVSNMQSVCAAFSARRRTTAGGTRSAARRCGAGRCARRGRRCVRACVCADVCERACAGVHVCR